MGSLNLKIHIFKMYMGLLSFASFSFFGQRVASGEKGAFERISFSVNRLWF